MRSHFLLLTPAIFLAGCLTTQENPNYEFSSRYKTEGQVQMAQTAPATEVTQATFETPAPAIQDVEVILEPSPTDAQFAAQEVTGTPGYMAIVEAGQYEVVPAVPATGTAQPIEYDYSQNLISADTPMATPDIADEVQIISPAGTDYIVKQGDTIYALSRQQCVGVDIIRGMNEIGTDYAIKIGQTIRLPESRC